MAKLFKQTWFKCVSVLLIIMVTSGGLLAILSDVLFVSPSERTGRALKKIYGKDVSSYETIIDSDGSDETKNTPYADKKGYGEIKKIYKVLGETEDSYDMLFMSVGKEGYKNGTITLWVKVSFSASQPNGRIDKVILESYEKQTLMSKLGASFYDGFLTDVTDDYLSGKVFTPNAGDKDNSINLVSGATKSANAGCNAVNCVLCYLSEAK